jgi:hypothetical protein
VFKITLRLRPVSVYLRDYCEVSIACCTSVFCLNYNEEAGVPNIVETQVQREVRLEEL